MSLHLIKLSVGPASASDLKAWQKQRLKELKAAGKKPELTHVTRHMPKRAQEILDGGSIYWVIKSVVVGRQKILELRPIEREGVSYCAIVYDKTFIPVRPVPKKAFQGWRYLEGKDAPDDINDDGTADLPEHLQRELRELGLL
jgi:hypothetical protein